MARSEDVLVWKSGNAQRVAVRCIAWLDGPCPMSKSLSYDEAIHNGSDTDSGGETGAEKPDCRRRAGVNQRNFHERDGGENHEYDPRPWRLADVQYDECENESAPHDRAPCQGMRGDQRVGIPRDDDGGQD